MLGNTGMLVFLTLAPSPDLPPRSLACELAARAWEAGVVILPWYLDRRTEVLSRRPHWLADSNHASQASHIPQKAWVLDSSESRLGATILGHITRHVMCPCCLPLLFSSILRGVLWLHRLVRAGSRTLSIHRGDGGELRGRLTCGFA